jgi:hypothetical protein
VRQNSQRFANGTCRTAQVLPDTALLNRDAGEEKPGIPQRREVSSDQCAPLLATVRSAAKRDDMSPRFLRTVWMSSLPSLPITRRSSRLTIESVVQPTWISISDRDSPAPTSRCQGFFESGAGRQKLGCLLSIGLTIDGPLARRSAPSWPEFFCCCPYTD